MAERDYIQPDLFSLAEAAAEDIAEQGAIALSPSDLQTALDILALAETVADLKLLEALTESQKRQVWAAVPETVRQKLKHLQESDQDTAIAQSPSAPSSPPSPSPPPSSLFHPGDRIVLKAKPRLTVAELLAIFEVIQVEGTLVQVKTKELGIRRYPLDWCLLYKSATPSE
jgi:hypothetical protein